MGPKSRGTRLNRRASRRGGRVDQVPAFEMARPIAAFVDPDVKSDRSRRSMDTDGSPASILATRDWLEPIRFASAAWVRFLAKRTRFSALANETRTSITAESASVRPRNSLASLTFHPVRSSRSLLSLRTAPSVHRSHSIVSFQSALTHVDDRLRSLPRLLARHLEDQDCIVINSKHDAPGASLIVDPQLAAPRPDLEHRSRVRHTQTLALLQHAKQKPSLTPGCGGEWWCLDLSMQPYQRPSLARHREKLCRF